MQVARCDALDLEVLGRVASQLENFGSQVFEDGGEVDRCLGSDARALAGDVAKVALYTTAGELEATRLAPVSMRRIKNDERELLRAPL